MRATRAASAARLLACLDFEHGAAFRDIRDSALVYIDVQYGMRGSSMHGRPHTKVHIKRDSLGAYRTKLLGCLPNTDAHILHDWGEVMMALEWGWNCLPSQIPCDA